MLTWNSAPKLNKTSNNTYFCLFALTGKIISILTVSIFAIVFNKFYQIKEISLGLIIFYHK